MIYIVSRNSTSNMTVNDGLTTSSLTLTSGGAVVKTYSVKGTQTGQVIAVSVEISGQSGKAEFEIVIE